MNNSLLAKILSATLKENFTASFICLFLITILDIIFIAKSSRPSLTFTLYILPIYLQPSLNLLTSIQSNFNGAEKDNTSITAI